MPLGAIIQHRSLRTDFRSGIAPGPVRHAVDRNCSDANDTRQRVRIVERWPRETGDHRLRASYYRPGKPEVRATGRTHRHLRPRWKLKKKSWNVISMKNDWKRIFVFDQSA